MCDYWPDSYGMKTWVRLPSSPPSTTLAGRFYGSWQTRCSQAVSACPTLSETSGVWERKRLIYISTYLYMHRKSEREVEEEGSEVWVFLASGSIIQYAKVAGGADCCLSQSNFSSLWWCTSSLNEVFTWILCLFTSAVIHFEPWRVRRGSDWVCGKGARIRLQRRYGWLY